MILIIVSLSEVNQPISCSFIEPTAVYCVLLSDPVLSLLDGDAASCFSSTLLQIRISAVRLAVIHESVIFPAAPPSGQKTYSPTCNPLAGCIFVLSSFCLETGVNSYICTDTFASLCFSSAR